MNEEKKHLPNISAQTIDGFLEIKEKLKELPYCIVAQIESITNCMGIECVIKTSYSNEINVLLPNFVSKIHNFGDYIGIYCGEFFFKIEKREKQLINYIILNPEEMKSYLQEDKNGE